MPDHVTPWGHGRVPLACRNCGRNDKAHGGKGLCTRSTCYGDKATRSRFGSLTEGTAHDVVDNETNPSGDDAVGPADGGAPVLDGGPVDQDSAVLDPPSLFSPGERSPAGGSPSPPRDAAGGTKKPSLRDRMRRKPKPPADASAPGAERRPGKPPKPPKRAHKRVSAADTLADAWGGAGSLAIRTGKHVPLGRCLQFQAPVAGEMLDEAVKGSFIDKLAIQPIVRARGRLDLFAAIAGPPALVFAIEQHPERWDILYPLLYSSVKNALPLMLPAMDRVRAKAEAEAEAAGKLLANDPSYEPGADPIEHVIRTMFAGWSPPPVPDAPQPESEAVPL